MRLTWDAQVGNAFAGQEYYYCVFRKLPGDKRFQYVVNVAKDEMEYTDRKLSKGQEAEYYVVLHFKDGRESQPSNVVKVKRAKEYKSKKYSYEGKSKTRKEKAGE